MVVIKIKDEDIIGYIVDEEPVCRGCVSEKEETEATSADWIIRAKCEDDEQYFCARCAGLIGQRG